MLYIAIEGLSGSGKTTVLREGLATFLQEHLKPRKVIFIEEPFPETTDHIMSILDPLVNQVDLDNRTEYFMLLSARSRLFHYYLSNCEKEVGSDKLVVVSESSMLRFCVQHRNVKEYPGMVYNFNMCRMAQGNTLPGVVLFLDTPPPLICTRKGNTVDENRVKNIEEARQAYLESLNILYEASEKKTRIVMHSTALQTPDGKVVDMPIRNVVQDCIEILRKALC